MEQEPPGEGDLTGRGGAFGPDAGDDDLLGGRRECREREGFEFGGGFRAAEEGFHAGDFVEVGHAGGGVSKGGRLQGRARAPFSDVGFRESWAMNGRPVPPVRLCVCERLPGCISACLREAGGVKD